MYGEAPATTSSAAKRGMLAGSPYTTWRSGRSVLHRGFCGRSQWRRALVARSHHPHNATSLPAYFVTSLKTLHDFFARPVRLAVEVRFLMLPVADGRGQPDPGTGHGDAIEEGGLDEIRSEVGPAVGPGDCIELSPTTPSSKSDGRHGAHYSGSHLIVVVEAGQRAQAVLQETGILSRGDAEGVDQVQGGLESNRRRCSWRPRRLWMPSPAGRR